MEGGRVGETVNVCVGGSKGGWAVLFKIFRTFSVIELMDFHVSNNSKYLGLSLKLGIVYDRIRKA